MTGDIKQLRCKSLWDRQEGKWVGPDVWGAGAAAPFTGSRIREGGAEKKTPCKACVGCALIGPGVVQGSGPVHWSESWCHRLPAV